RVRGDAEGAVGLSASPRFYVRPAGLRTALLPVALAAELPVALAALTTPGAVLADQLLHLLALLRSQHRLRLAERVLAVAQHLLVQRLHLLAEALHRLALLVGELAALATLGAVTLAAATPALHPLPLLALLPAARPELGEPRLPPCRLHALHQRRVAALEPLLDRLQPRDLRIGQAALLPVAEER